MGSTHTKLWIANKYIPCITSVVGWWSDVKLLVFHIFSRSWYIHKFHCLETQEATSDTNYYACNSARVKFLITYTNVRTSNKTSSQAPWKIYVPVVDLKGGFQCARDWLHKARKARALGGVARGRDMSPRKIFDFGPSEIAFGAVLEWNSMTNCQSSPCVWNL